MENNVWLNFTGMKDFNEDPFIVEHAENEYVYDIKGEKYLDAISGIWNAGLGYSRKDIVDNIYKELNNLPLTSLFGRVYPLIINYSNRLLKLAPDFDKIFFGTGGSDSVETAMKVARQFYFKQGYHEKTKIAHFKNSYHGVSYGALTVMGETANTVGYAVNTDDTLTLPWPDDVNGQTDKIFDQLNQANPNKIAAIILEPVIGSGGLYPFPDEFLKELRKYTKDNNILLIFDEVVTGFGRTGNLFAYQGLKDVVPDIMVLAKTITAGYAPLGATLFSKEITDVFNKNNVRLLHGYTNAGSVIGVAAADKVLDIIENENILENVRKQSTHLLTGLKKLKEKYPHVINTIRGKGLMIGVQISSPTKTNLEIDTFYDLLNHKNHILSRSAYDNICVLMPPLNSTQGFIDDLLNKFEKTINDYENVMKKSV